ncbi:MAG TPA: AAA family ATPase, partial [Terriglobales bacterium]|nr:AAA family ATPase [Terriglobales bacterium]
RNETSGSFQGPIATAPTLPEPVLVQRRAELDTLAAELAQAKAGSRRIVFVTGEAGAGKTSLVRLFLAHAHRASPVCIGEGQCMGNLAEGEPYMPLLEAAAQLARGGEGWQFIEVLKRHAPTWLLQLPSLIEMEELDRIRQQLAGVTRDRMLREMVEALETFTADRAVVLVLEDVHWSDRSTLDVLARFASGTAPARLLVLATFRPADARSHWPPYAAAQELILKGHAREVPISLLSEESIAEYLQGRFGSAPPELARLLHQRTDGNPLFVTTLVSSWAERGYLRASHGRCKVSLPVQDIAADLPASLRSFIERHLEQLTAEERQVIEAAAVAGRSFCSALLSPVLEWPSEKAEVVAASLARREQLIRRDGVSEWPDGTICEGFAFVHGLYREMVYDLVPAGRRVRYHQQLGIRLETAFAGREDAVAAELALHFSEARDASRGLRFHRRAAELALTGSGYPEAVFHIRKALELSRRLPEVVERESHELPLQAMLAHTLVAMNGFSDAEAETAYRRAAELAPHSLEPSLRFPAIFGLATMLEVRGEFTDSQQLMQANLPGQEKTGEFLVDGLDLLACSLFHQGLFQDALRHATRGAAAEFGALPLNACYGEHPVVGCETWAALASWFLGYPDQALQRARRATAMAEDPANFYSLAGALLQQAAVHQLRQEPQACKQCAERALEVAVRQGFAYRQAVALVLRGWAIAKQGQTSDGLASLRKGLDSCRQAGAELDRPYYLAILAEVLLARGKTNEALAAVSEAISLVRPNTLFYYEAELWRLRGVLLSREQRAEESLLKALELARAQQARSLELRAAISMAELWHSAGDTQRAYELVTQTYAVFSEGLHCPDLVRAENLLQILQTAKERTASTRLIA